MRKEGAATSGQAGRTKAFGKGEETPERVNKLTVRTNAPSCPRLRLTANRGQPGGLNYRLVFISAVIMSSVVVMILALAW